MPKGKAPYNKNKNTRNDNGESFQRTLKAKDGKKYSTRIETTKGGTDSVTGYGYGGGPGAVGYTMSHFDVNTKPKHLIPSKRK